MLAVLVVTSFEVTWSRLLLKYSFLLVYSTVYLVAVDTAFQVIFTEVLLSASHLTLVTTAGIVMMELE